MVTETLKGRGRRGSRAVRALALGAALALAFLEAGVRAQEEAAPPAPALESEPAPVQPVEPAAAAPAEPAAPGAVPGEPAAEPSAPPASPAPAGEPAAPSTEPVPAEESGAAPPPESAPAKPAGEKPGEGAVKAGDPEPVPGAAPAPNGAPAPGSPEGTAPAAPLPEGVAGTPAAPPPVETVAPAAAGTAPAAPADSSAGSPALPSVPQEGEVVVQPAAVPGPAPAASGIEPPAAARPPVPGLPAGAPTAKGGGGLLQRMARSLFGEKETETGLAPGLDEESLSAETRESLRKAKELSRLALQNIEKKRISEAKKNLNDLITLKPYEADYHLALGLCFRQEKRYKDAQKKYQDVLDLGGPRSLVTLLMAEVSAEAGEKEKVFELLKEAAVGGRNIIHDVQNLPLLEKYKGDTEFIKLALYLEKFEVVSKRGQDPFTNPFPASQPTGTPKGPTANPSAPLTLNPQEQQNFLNDARRLYEKVQWYIKLEDEDKAMENYIKLREMVEKKDLLTLPKIINDFRILVGRMEQLETQIEGIRLKYYWNQAQARLKDLKEAFQATEYQKVDALYADVEKLSKEMEKANPRFKPVAERILSAGRVWLNRANVRREFQAQKPDIQGVVIASDAKMAIIDSRIYKQGESFGEFHIQKVENNRVTFRYKGEEIPLIFRRY